MKKMLICSNCKKAFAVNHKDRMIKCPDCGGVIVNANVSKEEWDALDKKERDELRETVAVTEMRDIEEVPEEDFFDEYYDETGEIIIDELHTLNRNLFMIFCALAAANVIRLIRLFFSKND